MLAWPEGVYRIAGGLQLLGNAGVQSSDPSHAKPA